MIYLCVSVQLVISSSTVSAEVFLFWDFWWFHKKSFRCIITTDCTGVEMTPENQDGFQ